MLTAIGTSRPAFSPSHFSFEPPFALGASPFPIGGFPAISLHSILSA